MRKYFTHNQEHTSYSLEELKDKEIKKSTPIRDEDQSVWTTASEIEEFKPLIEENIAYSKIKKGLKTQTVKNIHTILYFFDLNLKKPFPCFNLTLETEVLYRLTLKKKMNILFLSILL